MSKTILDSNFSKRSISILILTLVAICTNAAINVITPLSNVTLCEGGSLNLNISLTSDHPVDYTWRHNGIVVGGNMASFTISTISLSQAGNYT
ncbi:MAG: immunoglobulin domain-containing protein, partial [Chitinophagales bacterium]